MSLLRCSKLSRAPWFKDLDLELVAGETRLLMGPTGSGKSLLLRTLADLDAADSGQVWLEGQERLQYKPGDWRRSVLYLHQSAPRLPGSVLDNLKATATEGREAQFNPFDLELSQPASELSGGQAQLLALTRALQTAPRVYLLDESTSALDEESSAHVERLLLERTKGGAAILWVSHDERIAGRMGGSVLPFGSLTP